MYTHNAPSLTQVTPGEIFLSYLKVCLVNRHIDTDGIAPLMVTLILEINTTGTARDLTNHESLVCIICEYYGLWRTLNVYKYFTKLCQSSRGEMPSNFTGTSLNLRYFFFILKGSRFHVIQTY